MPARRTKPHPDAKLTIAQAFEKHYDKSELAKTTLASYRIAFTRWGELTGDPPVGRIDNETVAGWRAKMLAKYTRGTVTGAWTSIRAVLRRLAPAGSGNPWGLGIIDGFPAMKAIRSDAKPPRRLALEMLDRFYVGCRHAVIPRNGPPAPWWWQALIVTAYFTGLRRGDLFRLRFDQLDLDGGTIRFVAAKTGKRAEGYPLHPVVVAHIRRIWSPRDIVFAGNHPVNGDFYRYLRKIQDKAGVERFGLHDLRRVGASEVERARSGMAAVFLQHKQHDVTHVSYLNQMEELTEAVNDMRCPLSFRQGVGMSERGEKERKKAVLKWQECLHSRPYSPEPSEWRFDVNAVWFRGEWRFMREAAPKRVLELLATTPRPVTFGEVCHAIWGKRQPPQSRRALEGRVGGCVSVVRGHLRQMLHLDADWDPVPCIERGNGGRWCLLFPPGEPMAQAGC